MRPAGGEQRVGEKSDAVHGEQADDALAESTDVAETVSAGNGDEMDEEEQVAEHQRVVQPGMIPSLITHGWSFAEDCAVQVQQGRIHLRRAQRRDGTAQGIEGDAHDHRVIEQSQTPAGGRGICFRPGQRGHGAGEASEEDERVRVQGSQVQREPEPGDDEEQAEGPFVRQQIPPADVRRDFGTRQLRHPLGWRGLFFCVGASCHEKEPML